MALCCQKQTWYDITACVSKSKRHAATNGQPARNRHAQKKPVRRSITVQRSITERRKATGCIRVRDETRVRIYNQETQIFNWIRTTNCTSHFTRLRPRVVPSRMITARIHARRTAAMLLNDFRFHTKKLRKSRDRLNHCSDLSSDETSDSTPSPARQGGISSSVIIDSCELRAPMRAESTPAIGLRGAAELQPNGSTTPSSAPRVSTLLRTRKYVAVHP